MNINYILLVHNNPAQVARLVQSLQAPTNHFYVHVDKNADIDPFREVLAAQNNMHILPEPVAIIWGDIGMVHATVLAMQQIVRDNRDGYCVLLSGQDYPLRSNTAIAHFFDTSQQINFIELFPLPSPKWEDGLKRIEYYKLNLSAKRGDFILLPSLTTKQAYSDLRDTVKNLAKAVWHKAGIKEITRRRRFPAYLQPHGGSQWWALPMKTVEGILGFLASHPDYLQYHKHTLVPDEIFFHSIVADFAKNDQRVVVKPSVTYTNWERPNVPLPVTFITSDYGELQAHAANFLFARKFDGKIDSNILDLMDNGMRQPADGQYLQSSESL